MQDIKVDKKDQAIESALGLWDFDRAYNLYKENIVQDSAHLQMDFCVFLNDSGKIDELLSFINRYSKSSANILECPSFWNNVKLNWESEIVSIQTYMTADTITLYKKMQLNQKINPNFLLNSFIKNNTLTADIAFDIMENCIKNTNNKTVRNYFLKTTLQYFCSTDARKQQDFFTPINPSSFITFLRLVDEEKSPGANLCYEETLIHYRNILLQQCESMSHVIPKLDNKQKPHVRYKKFAICLYGILRGDYKATLEDIITNLAIPLNADVFLFTWDMHQIWPGLCGWANWVMRMLEPALCEVVPFEVSYHSYFPKLLPNVYQKLDSEYSVPLDVSIIRDLQSQYSCFKHYEIVNQEQTQYEGKEMGGGYHLYYGIHRSIEVMKQYEILHNITYDFIFTFRSDGDIRYIKKDMGQALEELQTCRPNEIFDTLGDGGNDNITMYGPREVMFALGSLYTFMKELNIKAYKDMKYNNHIMSFLYLTMCGVTRNKVASIEQQYGMGNKCQKGMSFPDVEQELLLDIKTLQQQSAVNQFKLQSFIDTFAVLKRVYPNNYLEKYEVNRKAIYRDPIREVSLQIAANNWCVGEEEKRYISPQGLKSLFKVIRLIGKYFPNARVRRQARNFIGFFNFLYRKVYGKSL